MKRSIAVFLNLLLGLAIALMQLYIEAINHHTLYDTDLWENKKTKPEKYLVGAWASMVHPRTLKDGKLDLGSWFSNNWFNYNRSLDFKQISFSYYNPCQFSFIIDQDSTRTVGITFHQNCDTTGFFFIADKTDKFIKLNRFSLSNSAFNQAQKENKVVVFIRADSLEVVVNGYSAITVNCPLRGKLKIGFRGDTQAVLVDEVMATNGAGKVVFAETFGYTVAPKTLFWFIWPLALGLMALYIGRNKNVIGALTVIHFLACLCVIYNTVTIVLWAKDYPQDRNAVDYRNVKIQADSEADIIANTIKALTDGNKKDYRVVLFIGSSQTWGAGVSKAELTVPAQLQKIINDSSVLFVNGAISGLSAPELYKIYIDNYIAFKPYLVVINLSHNDADTLLFSKTIQKFVAANKSQNVKTALIAEPCRYLQPNIAANHQFLNHFADSLGIPLCTMQHYLEAYSDSGFIWWDNVHLTDYGYTIFAQKIAPDIKSILDGAERENKILIH